MFINEEIFVAGGSTDIFGDLTSYVTNAERYDPARNIWVVYDNPKLSGSKWRKWI